MKIDILQIISYVRKSPFIKSCLLEVVKASVTFLFGYISFSIYERYKNKKDNNKLYVQFLRLEKEILNNKRKIDNTLNEYIALEVLNQQFYIDNTLDNDLLELYSCVNQLNIYREEHVDYEDGEVDVIYTENPDELIMQIESELVYLEENYNNNYEEIEDNRDYIQNLKSKNIYNDLKDIEIKLEKFLDKEFLLAPQIRFLHEKFSKFNNLEEIQKRQYLTRFCKFIFDKENDFTNSLHNYNTMLNLKKKLDAYGKAYELDVKFSLWNEIEINLLAVYDAELYLKLEEVYTELNSFKIFINRKETLDKAKNIIVEKLDPIINNNKEHLKDILLKTNKLFKSV